MKKVLITLFFLSFSFLFAQSKISVAIPPLQFIVEKIAKNHIFADSLFSENYFEDYPSKSYLRKLSYSPIYLSLNLQREKSYIADLKAISRIKIIDVTKGINKIDGNPYLWMDPLSFRKIVINVYDEIVKLDNKNEKLYKANLDKFLRDIDAIFLSIKEQLFSLSSYDFYTFNDYWDYYAKRFRLNLYKKKKETLDAKEISDTITFTRKHDIKYFLVDPTDPKKIVDFFAKNSEAKPLVNNIFEKNWQANIFIFTQKIYDMYK
ncbi:hypothetical protein CRV00_07925 [Malaciobacter molluscorum]|uniref:metal ABC transporter solute-binding protein, Zn/Mn family n=1 Tax=Malaciobacter molluscorum TaxID=1032072 RepID=UPI00100C25B3|nr:zinc ABC transporter substrate-binding protein [Malaciobacter molluscorum]RXJ94148.1 hypothetical protein CRV00_07925 [Malaciobacter molluscorum]